jgi:hypothetical protein
MTDLANLPDESSDADRGHRFFHRADGDLSGPVRLRRAIAGATPGDDLTRRLVEKWGVGLEALFYDTTNFDTFLSSENPAEQQDGTQARICLTYARTASHRLLDSERQRRGMRSGPGHARERQGVIAGSRLLIYADCHSAVHRTAAQTDLRRGQRAGGIGRRSAARERHAAGET